VAPGVPSKEGDAWQVKALYDRSETGRVLVAAVEDDDADAEPAAAPSAPSRTERRRKRRQR